MEPNRVLLVEDNDDTGAALCMLLERAGFNVQWTRTAAETQALLEEAAHARAPLPDVILLDLMLPDSSGAQLADDLREKGCLPSVVLHSAAPDSVIREAAKRMGALATLRKPVDCGYLIDTLWGVTARRMRSNIA